VTIPRVTTVATGVWLPADGTTISSADPAFGQLGLAPKFVAAHVRVSRQLLLQSAADRVAGAQVAEAIARAIDTAVIAGTGTLGQPAGIINTTGIGTQSGASLAASGLRSMRKAALDAGAREDALTWLGGTDVQNTIGGREFSAGSGRPLWDDGKILGRPAVASSLVPAGTLLCGDFSRVTVAVFDAAGCELEFNPYANFQSGIVSFRLIVPVDITVSPAAAFSVATSVT
jgi:HK97 family phage major capsid protein